MRNKHVMIAVGAFMTALVGFLLLHSHTNLADPFERFKAFSEAHANVKVSYSIENGGKPGASGTLLFQKPGRTLFKSSLGSDTYSASNTEEGYRELDTADLTYDESPTNKQLGVHLSRISGAPGSAPGFILVPDLHKIVPPKPTITSKGDGNEIYGKAQGRTGTSEVWAEIDAQGKITKYRIKEDVEGRSTDRTWKLTYEFPSKLSLKDFLTPIPMGYVPFALPQTLIPLQKGSKAPVAGWHREGATVNLLDEAHQKPFLLAVVDSDFPSQSAMASLKSLKSKMPVFVVGSGELSDPSGKLLQQLNPPGAPTFYLIGGSGKVLKLWYGYDAADAASFEKDVVDAAADTKS
jgi:hypothetical protein